MCCEPYSSWERSVDMKKLRFLTKLETVNLVVTIIGIIMILCSSLFLDEQDSSYSKFLNIVGDLGIGIFPTGVIGFVLERMQNRSKEQEKRDKRLAILSLFNNAVHGYLNIICNSAIKANNNLKGEKLFYITNAVNSNEIQLNICDEEKIALTILVERLQESFGTTNPLYIVTDVFEAIEIANFEMLLNDGNKLLRTIYKGTNVMDMRSNFLSYIQATCLAIPECNCFNEMVSDGDNIYIPQNQYS